jgi:hypothetical protein
MNDRLALASLTLLLLGLLALIISGAVREVIVIPLLFLFWLVRLVYESIPQVALWVVFLAIAARVAWKSLAAPPAALRVPQAASINRTPVAAWAWMLQRAANDRYARWLLAQRLGQLAQRLLASQDEHATRGLWQFLHDESWDIPPAVRAYLQAGTHRYRPTPPYWRRWRPWGARVESRADPLDLDPAEVVRFLDERLSRSTGEQL